MSISNIEVAERLVAAAGGRNAPGKVAEKSNFAQTCNLLSQYLKEKRNFGDLPRGMSGIFESKGRSEAIPAANLLPTAAGACETSPALKPLAFFPQVAGFQSSDPRNFSVNKSDIRIPADAMVPETAQMTIFYAGEVMVYDDFPAERVKEMMALAAQGSPQNPVCHFSSTALAGPNVTLNPSRHAVVPKVASEPRHVLAQECPETSTQPIGPVDMPIARRNSLHRFLAKRKDRSTARAPYQVTKPFAGTPKGEESNSCSRLTGMEAQSSEHLELKL